MSVNPATWPLAGKIIGVGMCALVAAGGVTYAVVGHGGGTKPVPGASSVPLSRTSTAPLSTAAPPPSTPSGLLAGCQVGEDTGSSFQPVTQQNVGDGLSAYQVTVTNNTSGPVTVSGFGVTFSAFGGRVGTDQPTVSAALMEPSERWNFTINVTNGVQVSVNTYLNMDCTVTSVDTSNGMVTPTEVHEQNGVVNTHDQDVQQAQQRLATDVTSLGNDSTKLNSDNSLASGVQTMQQEYGSEQQDWKAEQQGNCMDGSLNYGPVTGDASAVGGYYNALKSDISALQSGPGISIAQVKQDLAVVQSEVSQLQALGTAPSPDPSSAVAAGNQALKNAANAIAWASQRGNTINAEAGSLATTAQNYASSHCGG
jgi:hypothetical protein